MKTHAVRIIVAIIIIEAAYLALANLDRVGVTAFADGVLADLPPVRGRRHVPRQFEFLRGLPRAAASTDLRRVAAALVRRPQPPGLTVIVLPVRTARENPMGFSKGDPELISCLDMACSRWLWFSMSGY